MSQKELGGSLNFRLRVWCAYVKQVRIRFKFLGVAAIAPWFCLRLPSCGLGFESQAHHLLFFQFVLLKMYRENNKNKLKKGRDWPIFKKIPSLRKTRC